MADRSDWRDRERSREWQEHDEGYDYREDYGRGLERHRDYGRPEWRGRGELGRYSESWGGALFAPGSANWGRYAGRGPKNYVRSDERIWEDVNERLTEHPQIDASDMEVQVKDGEVTLTGMVEDRRSKHLAADIAESVAGVREVYNQLRIHHPAGM